MENNIEKKYNSKALIVPIVSIAAFLLLMFGAGYAYYTTTQTYNTAYGNVVMPARQSLTCTKVDSSIILPAANSMLPAKNGTVAGNGQAQLKCTCSGGGTCGFTVTAKNAVAFTPVTGNEVTVDISSASCTAKTGMNVNSTGVSTTCSVASGSTATVNGDFHFWNVNADQSNRAGIQFKFSIATSGATFS